MKEIKDDPHNDMFNLIFVIDLLYLLTHFSLRPNSNNAIKLIKNMKVYGLPR